MGEQQAIHESTHPLPHEPAASAGWKVGLRAWGSGPGVITSGYKPRGWAGEAGVLQGQITHSGALGVGNPELDCSSHLFPQGWAAGEREKEGLHADVGAHGPEPAAPSQARMCFP